MANFDHNVVFVRQKKLKFVQRGVDRYNSWRCEANVRANKKPPFQKRVATI